MICSAICIIFWFGLFLSFFLYLFIFTPETFNDDRDLSFFAELNTWHLAVTGWRSFPVMDSRSSLHTRRRGVASACASTLSTCVSVKVWDECQGDFLSLRVSSFTGSPRSLTSKQELNGIKRPFFKRRLASLQIDASISVVPWMFHFRNV